MGDAAFALCPGFANKTKKDKGNDKEMKENCYLSTHLAKCSTHVLTLKLTL